MYERSYGSKYHETQGDNSPGGRNYLGAADIAKLMRADIKDLVKAGKLSKDVKTSVTVENYSMGRSINIRVLYRPEFWQECEGIVPSSKRLVGERGYVATACGNVWCAAREDRPGAEKHMILTIEGERVRLLIKAIHRAYNYDGSEVQVDYFDVNYYGQVEVESADSANWRAKETARKAKLKDESAERKELIAWLARRTIYKAGRLRNASTEKLRALKAKIEA